VGSRAREPVRDPRPAIEPLAKGFDAALSRFVRLWSTADAAPQPHVAEARARLREFSAEH
jgi:hypothetical protein